MEVDKSRVAIVEILNVMVGIKLEIYLSITYVQISEGIVHVYEDHFKIDLLVKRKTVTVTVD